MSKLDKDTSATPKLTEMAKAQTLKNAILLAQFLEKGLCVIYMFVDKFIMSNSVLFLQISILLLYFTAYLDRHLLNGLQSVEAF